MSAIEVAYLGPSGTYSHLVAEKKYRQNRKLMPMPTILDVCSFVAAKPSLRRGIIPIENSSGGAIYETVDILLANKPKFYIEEELSLDVKLALLGQKGGKIKVLYSHFAPLEHCSKWIKRHLPGVEKRVVSSTAVAAEKASADQHAAALGSRKLSKIYNLDIIHYPVEADVPNITVFLAIGHKPENLLRDAKTTLAVNLPNTPGSLCTFLDAFRSENVNLSRIISRPIRGCPREYAFLVDIKGTAATPSVKRALITAKKTCVKLREVGSYPSRASYKS